MKPGDLIRYKHNGKMGVIIRIDNSRQDLPLGIDDADTHLVFWGFNAASNKQKWFVSPDWIERVEDNESR